MLGGGRSVKIIRFKSIRFQNRKTSKLTVNIRRILGDF